ncbi:hypothetical protein SERLA73DRAFT_176813, partial [Serpula lacrymans var. lacrymans S7.3]
MNLFNFSKHTSASITMSRDKKNYTTQYFNIQIGKVGMGKENERNRENIHIAIAIGEMKRSQALFLSST